MSVFRLILTPWGDLRNLRPLISSRPSIAHDSYAGNCHEQTIASHPSCQCVTLVDPRSAFATAERFPDTRLVDLWPREALSEIGLDARTALVALSHDAKLDDPALVAALESEVFYIGALGSRRNQQRRLERLRAHGFSDDQLERIHGPVGIDIGARSPAEIAVSIVAEIVRALRMGA